MAERWVSVAKIDEIPVGERKVVTVDDEEICIFNIEGKLYAIDNPCPHASFPLHRGHLTGKVILCPFHCWDFDVETGASPTIPGAYVMTWPTRVQGDRIELEVEEVKIRTRYVPPRLNGRR